MLHEDGIRFAVSSVSAVHVRINIVCLAADADVDVDDFVRAGFQRSLREPA